MLFVILLLVFISGGVFLGILFNKKVTEKYPHSDAIEHKVVPMIIFAAAVVVMFTAAFIGISVNSAVKKYSVELESYIMTNHSDIEFVQNGLNMMEVNENISVLNKSISDLKEQMWPHAQEIGIPRFAYNYFADYITREIRRRVSIVNTAGRVANVFANKDNYLTVNSIMNGLRKGISAAVFGAVIIIILVCIVAAGVYVLVTLYTAKRDTRKYANIAPKTEEEIQTEARARREAEAQAKAFD